jgi:hypothetical protein
VCDKVGVPAAEPDHGFGPGKVAHAMKDAPGKASAQGRRYPDRGAAFMCPLCRFQDEIVMIR